jgi:hypothetical protein
MPAKMAVLFCHVFRAECRPQDFGAAANKPDLPPCAARESRPYSQILWKSFCDQMAQMPQPEVTGVGTHSFPVEIGTIKSYTNLALALL